MLNIAKMIDKRLMNMESLKRFEQVYTENDQKLTKVEQLIEERQHEQMLAMLEEFKGDEK